MWRETVVPLECRRYVGELVELRKGCHILFRGSRGKVGFLSRCCSGKGPHLALRGECPCFSQVVAGYLKFLSSSNGDLRDPLVFPAKSQASIRVASGFSGFLSSWCRGIGTPWVETGTSGLLSRSDMALGVPMGFQQGSQASSCVETWKSALLSRCKTGVRLPVELYRDMGILLEVPQGCNTSLCV